MRREDLTIHMRGDVVVIVFSSIFCLCPDEELTPLIANQLEQGGLKFILDLRQVEYITSVTLGGVVKAHSMVTGKGGRLILLGVVRRIRELLDKTNLSQLIEMFDVEADARQSLK